MPSTQDIRRRIRSIKNTRQITKAMELVAGAKMRKAQEQALASRTYAKLAWELIERLSDKTDPKLHRLLSRPQNKAGKTGVLLITSNRGLIGAFNNNIIGTAREYAKQQAGAEFVTLGKKGRDAVRKFGFEVAAEFEKQDTAGAVSEIAPISRLLIDDFLEGKFDKVAVVYMDFISTLKQQPHVRVLLPLKKHADETLGEVGIARDREDEIKKQVGQEFEYLFEPTAEKVLETLVPRMVEMQIYQALLETNAAEHSARMIAMKNASDSATELVDELTLQYNQIRQANITKEISEIVGGRLALEN